MAEKFSSYNTEAVSRLLLTVLIQMYSQREQQIQQKNCFNDKASVTL